MMFSLRACFLLILICSMVSSSVVRHIPNYPLGVSFGEESITAARFIADGYAASPNRYLTSELVASVNGSQAYREYMADALAHEGERFRGGGDWWVLDAQGGWAPAPPDIHDHNATRDIFIEALASLKAEMKTIGYTGNQTIAAFTVPQHLNASSRNAAVDAMLDADTGIIQYWQRSPQMLASRYAYQLDRGCETFGILWGECDDEEYLVIVLEHNKDRLDLYVADGANLEYHARINLTNVNETQPVITDALLAMKASHYYNGKTAHQSDGMPVRNAVSYVHAVILSGEASPGSFDILRLALSETLPEIVDKVHDWLDPRFVPAIGAAYQAMGHAENPDSLKELDLCTLQIEFSHDEL